MRGEYVRSRLMRGVWSPGRPGYVSCKHGASCKHGCLCLVAGRLWACAKLGMVATHQEDAVARQGVPACSVQRVRCVVARCGLGKQCEWSVPSWRAKLGCAECALAGVRRVLAWLCGVREVAGVCAGELGARERACAGVRLLASVCFARTGKQLAVQHERQCGRGATGMGKEAPRPRMRWWCARRVGQDSVGTRSVRARNGRRTHHGMFCLLAF